MHSHRSLALKHTWHRMFWFVSLQHKDSVLFWTPIFTVCFMIQCKLCKSGWNNLRSFTKQLMDFVTNFIRVICLLTSNFAGHQSIRSCKGCNCFYSYSKNRCISRIGIKEVHERMMITNRDVRLECLMAVYVDLPVR